MSHPALRRALTEPSTIRPLPPRAEELLTTLASPPRLAAHLRAVHDVAVRLVDWVALHHPTVEFDREAVLFGAATHDIGKTLHPDELSGPGSAHEQAGYDLLRAHGVDHRLARFARDHASWTGPDIGIEDLLVTLADKVWKAKRVPDLEQRVVEHLPAGQEPWAAFMALDDFLDALAADADSRLAFQATYPIAV